MELSELETKLHEYVDREHKSIGRKALNTFTATFKEMHHRPLSVHRLEDFLAPNGNKKSFISIEKLLQFILSEHAEQTRVARYTKATDNLMRDVSTLSSIVKDYCE